MCEQQANDISFPVSTLLIHHHKGPVSILTNAPFDLGASKLNRVVIERIRGKKDIVYSTDFERTISV
jgi:hypothetical protein